MFRLSKYSSLIICMEIFLVSSFTLSSQTDTLYVKKYYTKLVPRVLTNYKFQTTSFITKTDSSYLADNFSTGGQNYIGLELDYRWISLSYNFGFNRDNSSTNTDLRLSTSYKPLRMQAHFMNLKNLDYYQVEGIKKQDTVFTGRQHDIAFQSVGLKLDYVFNYKNFYYSSSISQFGRQLKSKGSFLLSSGISFQDFDLRGLADTSALKFSERYNANHFKTTRIDLGVGYAYNWVLTKKFVIYISELPNLGLQQVTTFGTGPVAFHATISLSNYVRIGAIYSWKRYFAGTYIYNSITTSTFSGYSYNNTYTSLQLHFGMILEDPKTYFKR